MKLELHPPRWFVEDGWAIEHSISYHNGKRVFKSFDDTCYGLEQPYVFEEIDYRDLDGIRILSPRVYKNNPDHQHEAVWIACRDSRGNGAILWAVPAFQEQMHSEVRAGDEVQPWPKGPWFEENVRRDNLYGGPPDRSWASIPGKVNDWRRSDYGLSETDWSAHRRKQNRPVSFRPDDITEAETGPLLSDEAGREPPLDLHRSVDEKGQLVDLDRGIRDPSNPGRSGSPTDRSTKGREPDDEHEDDEAEEDGDEFVEEQVDMPFELSKDDPLDIADVLQAAKILLTDRQYQAFKAHLGRATYDQIGDRLGISAMGAHHLCRKAKKTIAKAMGLKIKPPRPVVVIRKPKK
jgi:hypothetical protein